MTAFFIGYKTEVSALNSVKNITPPLIPEIAKKGKKAFEVCLPHQSRYFREKFIKTLPMAYWFQPKELWKLHQKSLVQAMLNLLSASQTQ